MPLLSTMRLTQIERGIAVERTSRASLLKARVKSETAALNHTHGSSAVMRKTMYGSSPDRALEDLGEDEPVDQAHHERVEHRPQVAQRAGGVAHPEVARREEPQRVQVAPGRARGADGGCGHGVESMGAAGRPWSARSYASWLFHMDSADPMAMCMSRYW